MTQKSTDLAKLIDLVNRAETELIALPEFNARDETYEMSRAVALNELAAVIARAELDFAQKAKPNGL